jgi:hypothetical protein
MPRTMTETRTEYLYLKDVTDDAVDGTFYESELSKVIVTEKMTFHIENMLKSKKNEVLVNWWTDPRHSIIGFRNKTYIFTV